MLRGPVLTGFVLISAACGQPAAKPVASPTPTTTPAFTTGLPPLGTLPDAAQPLRAALGGSGLIILAHGTTDSRLSLYDFNPITKTTRQTQLLVESAGAWSGLGVDDAGITWVGIRDRLIRVDASGMIDSFVLPPVRFPLAQEFRLAEPSGPPPGSSGFVAALAVTGDRVTLGRTDASELLVFDRGTRGFQQWPLPSGTGDIAELFPGPRNTVVFAVDRSGRVRGLLNDRVGIIDPATGNARTLDLPTRGVAVRSSMIALGGSALSVVDENWKPLRPPSIADQYDVRRIALRADDSVAIRVNASHELAIVDLRGREVTRIEYAVPIVPLSTGAPQPYNSPLAYLVAAPDNSVWFSLIGRPEIYQAR